MAAGINILVNDGGAPARIMKVGNAGADIDAGTFVKFDGTNVVVADADLPDTSDAIGVLFVDATSGDPASVVTGSGIQVFLKATGTVNAGQALGHDASGLAKNSGIAATDQKMAVALEGKGDTHTGFVKALLL
tara:strand:+ start:1864 stop:2262 length:399 start_codon:yes stop_codon:yes gene_type:complete